MREPSIGDEERFTEQMEAHYAAVGKVASNWADFEHRIQWAIWNIAGLDNLTGACITVQIGNSARMIDVVISLLHLKDAPENAITALNKFAEKVGKKQRQRNRIIHDPWTFRWPSGDPSRHELSANKRLISGLIPQSTSEIEAFANEIIDLVDEFEAVLNLALPPP